MIPSAGVGAGRRRVKAKMKANEIANSRRSSVGPGVCFIGWIDDRLFVRPPAISADVVGAVDGLKCVAIPLRLCCTNNMVR
uniref:Uncharacterized protein n=1 Tax=Setaria digitata TaxID=48799 RepID=A0A915PR33_9BILA